MNEYFYCYSKKLSHFIMAYDIPYVSKSVNKKNGMPYHTFKKSERLDKVIAFYKTVIHAV